MNELKNSAILQGGKYRIEKSLGQGGFGITYLAEQTNLGRKVCIKEFFIKEYGERTAVPSENSGDDTVIVRESATVLTEVTAVTSVAAKRMEVFRKRFVKEAKTIAKLYHPGVVGIHDVFEENGTAYYVMDFIEGENLNDMVKREGALSEERALGYIRQVADALSYVHSHNIMHLDVKPANIIVRKSDDKAILIDFGAAKQYDSEGSQTSTTPIGISVGYAPLEMTKPGGVQTFSPETDVYSLGATLYYLVTGQNPPDASERMEMLMDGEKMQYRDTVPSLVMKAIETAMQARKQRPKSIQAFIDMLDESPSEVEEKTRMEEKRKEAFRQGNERAEERRIAEDKAMKEAASQEIECDRQEKEDIKNWHGIVQLAKSYSCSSYFRSTAPARRGRVILRCSAWFKKNVFRQILGDIVFTRYKMLFFPSKSENSNPWGVKISEISSLDYRREKDFINCIRGHCTFTLCDGKKLIFIDEFPEISNLLEVFTSLKISSAQK